MRNPLFRPARVIGALVIGVVMLGTGMLVGRPTVSHATPPGSGSVESTIVANRSKGFAAIAERVKPSVVYVTSKRTGVPAPADLEVPAPFRQFFGTPVLAKSDQTGTEFRLDLPTLVLKS